MAHWTLLAFIHYLMAKLKRLPFFTYCFFFFLLVKFSFIGNKDIPIINSGQRLWRLPPVYLSYLLGNWAPWGHSTVIFLPDIYQFEKSHKFQTFSNWWNLATIHESWDKYYARNKSEYLNSRRHADYYISFSVLSNLLYSHNFMNSTLLLAATCITCILVFTAYPPNIKSNNNVVMAASMSKHMPKTQFTHKIQCKKRKKNPSLSRLLKP